MATPDATLKELLSPERPDAAKVREFLDGLDHAGRMTAVTALQGQTYQAKLYDIARGAPPVTLDQLVPADFPALREVIWHGKNSLPMFTLFQKRFCRPRSTTASCRPRRRRAGRRSSATTRVSRASCTRTWSTISVACRRTC
jgi:hypothetical protein